MTIEAVISGIVSLLQTLAPPGQSPFSVTPVAEKVDGAVFSTFYNSYVVKETAAAGTLRYTGIAKGLERAVTRALCVDAFGHKVDGCTPIPSASTWTWNELAGVQLGVAIYESGFREDVQVGRGRSGCTKGSERALNGKCKPDDAGGQGRGPGNEACLAQIHPTMGGGEKLLGLSEDAVERCFYRAAEMMIHSRWHCRRHENLGTWVFRTVSYYATGRTCADYSKKVAFRTGAATRLIPKVQAITRQPSR